MKGIGGGRKVVGGREVVGGIRDGETKLKGGRWWEGGSWREDSGVNWSKGMREEDFELVHACYDLQL